MSEPTLTYFDLRGRAEASRLLLIENSIPFTDERIRSAEDWKRLQPELPFGALPLLKDGNKSLSQSQTILRYLVRKYGLVPDGPDAMATFDELHEAIAEYQEELWRFAWQEEYRTDPETYANGILKRHLHHLQDRYTSNSDEFWIGTSVSHIDCLAFVYTDELRAFFPQTLKQFHHLQRFHNSFAERPNVQQYIKSGRRPVVFGMGLHGPKIDPAVTHSPGDSFKNPWSDPIPLYRDS